MTRFNITPDLAETFIDVTKVEGTPGDFTVEGMPVDRDETDLSVYVRRFAGGKENGHAFALLTWWLDPRAEEDGLPCECGVTVHEVTVDTNEAYGTCPRCDSHVYAYGYAFGASA